MNPVQNFPHYFPRIHSNITFSSTPRSSELSLPFKFTDQNFVYVSHLFCTCYIHCSSHTPWFDQSKNIWSLLGPSILLNTLFLNTLSLYSSLNVRDQVSHSYKTQVFLIYIFCGLDVNCLYMEFAQIICQCWMMYFVGMVMLPPLVACLSLSLSLSLLCFG
jgi:hypothetical protein